MLEPPSSKKPIPTTSTNSPTMSSSSSPSPSPSSSDNQALPPPPSPAQSQRRLPSIPPQATHAYRRHFSSPVPSSQQSSQGSTTSSTASTSSFIIKCETTNTKTIQQVLQCLHFKERQSKDQWVMWQIGGDGIRIICEDNRCFQAKAFLPRGIFNSYLCTSDYRVTISLPLGQLLNNINTFVANLEATSMKIQYPGMESSVHVLMTQGDSVMQFSVKTKAPEEPAEFNYKQYSSACRVIAKAPVLRFHLADLEHFSDSVKISVNEDAMSFSSGGDGFEGGEYELNIPSNSPAVLSFSAIAEQTSRFKTGYIMALFKALSVPERTCIRMNEGGMLYVLNLVKVDEYKIHIELVILPEEEQVEDMDDDKDGEENSLI